MNEYSIEIFDNHIIALIEGKRVLVDSGAPTSISDGCSLRILGNNYSFPPNFEGFSIDQLNQLLGTKINMLLGADVLKTLNFFVDWDRKTHQFSVEPIDIKGTHIPMDLKFMNIPIVVLQVDGTSLKVFLDTGAKLSYLDPDITSKYNLIGREQDFYPGIGQFKTNIYEVPVMLGNHTFTVIAGNLHRKLQMSLMRTNTQGILGNDIFKHFNMCFNYTPSKIILAAKNSNVV